MTHLLDVRQVAAMLRVSTRTVWRMAATGVLPPPIRLSPRLVRWRSDDIDRVLTELAQTKDRRG